MGSRLRPKMRVSDLLGTICGVAAAILGYLAFSRSYLSGAAGFIPGAIAGSMGYGIGFGIGHLIDRTIENKKETVQPDLRPRRPDEERN